MSDGILQELSDRYSPPGKNLKEELTAAIQFILHLSDNPEIPCIYFQDPEWKQSGRTCYRWATITPTRYATTKDEEKHTYAILFYGTLGTPPCDTRVPGSGTEILFLTITIMPKKPRLPTVFTVQNTTRNGLLLFDEKIFRLGSQSFGDLYQMCTLITIAYQNGLVLNNKLYLRSKIAEQQEIVPTSARKAKMFIEDQEDTSFGVIGRLFGIHPNQKQQPTPTIQHEAFDRVLNRREAVALFQRFNIAVDAVQQQIHLDGEGIHFKTKTIPLDNDFTFLFKLPQSCSLTSRTQEATITTEGLPAYAQINKKIVIINNNHLIIIFNFRIYYNTGETKCMLEMENSTPKEVQKFIPTNSLQNVGIFEDAFTELLEEAMELFSQVIRDYARARRERRV